MLDRLDDQLGHAVGIAGIAAGNEVGTRRQGDAERLERG